MPPGDLTTVSNALAWLGEDADDDDIVERLVSAVSTLIQKFLGFQVLSASYSRSFNGVGGRMLVLPDRPLTAVASLSIDGLSVPFSTDPRTPGFVFDDTTLYLRGPYCFARGAQNTAAQYTAGYASVPGDIEQACLDWVKLTYDNLDTLPGITALKAGDSQITYGEAFAKLGNVTIPMPAVVATVLLPYRRVTPT